MVEYVVVVVVVDVDGVVVVIAGDEVVGDVGVAAADAADGVECCAVVFEETALKGQVDGGSSHCFSLFFLRWSLQV